MTVAVLAASAPGYGIKYNGCSAQPSSLSMKTEKVIAPMSETRSHRPWRADHILVWNPKRPNEPVLWESTVELGKTSFRTSSATRCRST